MTRLIAALPLMLLLSACDRYSQLPQCSSFLDTGHPVQMVLEPGGSALDAANGLRWYRCSAGQRFSNEQCTGEALALSQADARQWAQEFAASAAQPWRLPTVGEMDSLKQNHCANPAVDTRIFPGIRVDNYWTSSSRLNGPGMGCTTYTYNGNSFCKEPVAQKRNFLIVMEAKR